MKMLVQVQVKLATNVRRTRPTVVAALASVICFAGGEIVCGFWSLPSEYGTMNAGFVHRFATHASL